MKSVAVIPARLSSTRFPGKPLKKILGMPMIGHCYFRAKMAEGLDEVYVATCDDEIAEYVRSIGGKAIMTSRNHTRPASRTAEAIEIIEQDLHKEVDIVVMVQGDEPTVRPKIISRLLDSFSNSEVNIVNIASEIKTLRDFNNKNFVKVVTDKRSNALYFSRESIPSGWQGWKHIPKYMQTGIIAFRKETLKYFYNAPHEESILEQIESIDMCRILDEGGEIRMVLTDVFLLSVNISEDIIKAEKVLLADPTTKKYLS